MVDAKVVSNFDLFPRFLAETGQREFIYFDYSGMTNSTTNLKHANLIRQHIDAQIPANVELYGHKSGTGKTTSFSEPRSCTRLELVAK